MYVRVWLCFLSVFFSIRTCRLLLKVLRQIWSSTRTPFRLVWRSGILSSACRVKCRQTRARSATRHRLMTQSTSRRSPTCCRSTASNSVAMRLVAFYFILFSNKGPKGLLQVATKYNIIQRIHSYLRIHITHIIHIFAYAHVIATQVLRTLFQV